MNSNIINKKLYFSGAMGTMLQEQGLTPGELPETWNIKKPEVVQKIHEEYIVAGCDFIETNTFGANRIKYPSGSEMSLEEVIGSGMRNAILAREKTGMKNVKIAFDVGPTGKMLQPLGDLSFDEAVQIFSESIRLGVAHGADLILIETMNDLTEAKAALLAAKECTSLPVWVTCVFNENSRMLTGADPEAMVVLLESLGADAIGLNCSLAPHQMLETAKRIINEADVSVIINPNAGLPVFENGKTTFDSHPKDFAEGMKEIALVGADILGGCCGTTPEHISQMINTIEAEKVVKVSSWKGAFYIKNKSSVNEIMDSRKNESLYKALQENNLDYLQDEIYDVEEEEICCLCLASDHSLEAEMNAIDYYLEELQGQLDKPLLFVTENTDILEKFLRNYNGRIVVEITKGLIRDLDKTLVVLNKYNPVLNVQKKDVLNKMFFRTFEKISLR